MDITAYLSQAPNDRSDGSKLNYEGPSTPSQTFVGRDLNLLQEELRLKRRRQIIPEKIKK